MASPFTHPFGWLEIHKQTERFQFACVCFYVQNRFILKTFSFVYNSAYKCDFSG